MVFTMRGNVEDSKKLTSSESVNGELSFHIKSKMKNITVFMSILLFYLAANHYSQLISCHQQSQAQQHATSFPGVSRNLASFCAARPSLPIDVASMIVHVKKNVSFNYKLYLFSADYVFQTGQVIPRDDFRIHSFPVKLKRLNEFWPTTVPIFKYTGSRDESFVKVPSNSFNLKQFFEVVPLIPQESSSSPISGLNRIPRQQQQQLPRSTVHRVPEDALGDILPGDELNVATNQTDSQNGDNSNVNSHIQFDRDDEMSPVSRRHAYYKSPEYLVPTEQVVGSSNYHHLENHHHEASSSSSRGFSGDAVIPVGAFSSFHVNLTYLVRKDFDQLQPQLIRIQVDAQQFLVTQLLLIGDGPQNVTNHRHNEDYEFLSHKLLRDPNTRITAINQIYEDWITRNFYTIVYIQRRLDEDNEDETKQVVVSDRLVFRGTSIALLGADQLDYSVKAAAFITEKNGLHYYLEFLTTSKFYLCAVDWTKRPFRIIDSRQFPIKVTRTQLDNEELLLCPPAVCYSNQPIDEIVSYGRISLADKVQRETQILSQSSSLSSSSASQIRLTTTSANNNNSSQSSLNETVLVYSEHQKELAARLVKDKRQVGETSGREDTSISSDSVIEAIKFGSVGTLQARLHLRDWVWILSRGNGPVELISLDTKKPETIGLPSFHWRYELARRNDIKVKPDTYGYVLTGHEIDASYRVYNELYLISANHLITINYTMTNETVVSTHPIGDEFSGLSSTVVDPITGAFYDRYKNYIYFFKGDRYIGYDYASKKSLDDFILQVPASVIQDDSLGVNFETQQTTTSMLSSLPVVGILGRQHQVDGVYHDFQSDLVFIFSGMKFYSFRANEFKNGSFKPASRTLPKMYCINEYFLSGCNFDKAYQNPCHSDNEDKNKSAKLQLAENENVGSQHSGLEIVPPSGNVTTQNNKELLRFNEEQQMKLRSIASTSLFDLLIEHSNLPLSSIKGATQTIKPFIGSSYPALTGSAGDTQTQLQEKVVVYLLMAMIVLTVFVTIALIVVLINWTKVKLSRGQNDNNTGQANEGSAAPTKNSARSHYLSNQQQHSRRHQYQSGHSHTGDPLKDRTIVSKTLLGPTSIVVAKSRRLSNNIDNSVL